jgi:hypothetical protein
MHMEVLVYSKTERKHALRLMSAIEKVVPNKMIHTCRSVQSLSLRLCQPGPPPEVTVLLATTRRELCEILTIQALLTDLRLILLIPDKREDTVAKGHSLYPRFLSYSDGDFADVSAVLRKMLSRWPGAAADGTGEGRRSSEASLMKKSIITH